MTRLRKFFFMITLTVSGFFMAVPSTNAHVNGCCTCYCAWLGSAPSEKWHCVFDGVPAPSSCVLWQFGDEWVCTNEDPCPE